MEKKVAAIILASGSGTRTGLDIPKQFLKIAGRPVLEHTLRTFLKCHEFDEIIVVGNPDFMDLTLAISDRLNDPRVSVVSGDRVSRQRSSLNGIKACPTATHVVIHDAARPLISRSLIARVLEKLNSADAVDVCIPASDTVVAKVDDVIREIPPRANMMLGQTPQAFRRDIILDAHLKAVAVGDESVTDDCGLVIKQGVPVHIVTGERTNMKITHLDDIYLIERLFQVARLNDAAELSNLNSKVGRTLVLGGTQGLGKSLSELLQRHQIDVLALGRNTAPAVDVTSKAAVNTFLNNVAEKGVRFDSVVYCPGILIPKRIEDYTEEDWERTFATNLKGVFHLLSRLDTLINPGGQFLALGSSSYSLGRAGYAAYSASKAALINFIQAAADEWPDFRLNVVSPQRARTGLRTNAFGSEAAAGLLDPKFVAERIFDIMKSDLTGMNFDIRVDAPLTPVH